jgi:succinate dehydrogenase/fumarate reductase flavoprotein subunit
MLPWIIGGALVAGAAALFGDDDDDDDYYDRAERRRERERENKRDRLLSDIEQYKNETKRRFKDKYGLKIEFDRADIIDMELSDKKIKKKEKLMQEITEIQDLIELLDEQRNQILRG